MVGYVIQIAGMAGFKDGARIGSQSDAKIARVYTIPEVNATIDSSDMAGREFL